MNRTVFHNREAVSAACCLKCREFNLVTNFDKYFYCVCQCIQHLYSNTVAEGFIYHMDLPFGSSGGKRGCTGVCLMSASCFSLPPYIHISFHFVHTCFLFYLCLLCCVVLYKWLEADLHGKSSDTADKTSGKEALRTKAITRPSFSLLFSDFQLPLNQIKGQSLKIKPKILNFFILLPDLNQYLINCSLSS